MLRTIIICPDGEAASCLEEAVKGLGLASILRIMREYPNGNELTRTLRALAPGAIFLSFESLEKAQQIVRFLEFEAGGVQIIAVHRVCDPQILRETMRAGVREFVEFPFERQTLIDAIKNTAGILQTHPIGYQSANQIFAFLPSKAGVGTSTLALNVSAAIARRKDTRVLLSDFDMNSGMMRFLLKLPNEFSVVDAVEHSSNMDENLWRQLVTPLGSLDVLHAGRVNPSLRIEPVQVRNLILFMSRNYDALCFDLSGNLERYAIELMHQAKRVLLVCTPEIPSLHLAREKMQFLRSVDLAARIGVILNRHPKRPLFDQKQVEEILGVPVMETLPNDYHGVNRATTAGTLVDEKSDLGKRYTEFAARLMETGVPQPQPPVAKRKFLENFSLPGSSLPAR